MNKIKEWIIPVLVAWLAAFGTYIAIEYVENTIYLPMVNEQPSERPPWEEDEFLRVDAPLKEQIVLAPNIVTEPAGIIHTGNQVLLENWFRLLEANEEIYGNIFRVLDYMDAYARNRTWDDLLKARASCSAALVEIRQMELPESQLSQSVIEEYVDAGVEIDAFLREFEELENRHKNMCDTVMLLNYTLEDDVFMKASVEIAIPAMVAFYREYFTLEYRYLCQYSNYLLLQIHDEVYWQIWSIALPYMDECAGEWYTEPEAVLQASDALLDEMQALQSEMGRFLGISEYTLEIVREAAETGDTETLLREINRHDDAPGCFPTPEWLPDVVHLYLVTDPETQEKRLVRAGEELTSVPTACYISCGVIAQEQVGSYVQRLMQRAIKTYCAYNDDGDISQVLAVNGASSMMIEWTPEDTLIYLTEPIGCLIPELYLDAIAAQK